MRQSEQSTVPAQGNKASKPLTEKTCGGRGSGRNSQPLRRDHWRDPLDPRTYTSPPTWESATEGANLIVGSSDSYWKLAETGASGTVPSWTPPPHTASQHSKVGCPAQGEHLRLHPFLHNTQAETKKKNGPNERTDQSSRKNTTKWQRDSQPIRCTVQTTGNQDAHRID